MSMTSIDKNAPWLSCDHTFRSSSNIGLFRQQHKHWVNQYSGLFCVFNSDGVVLTWKLTKSLAFDIAEQLTSLNDHFVKQGCNLQEFFY